MQILNHIPDVEEVALPAITSINLLELLIEPFGALDSANQFWQQYPSTILILNKNDDPEKALAVLESNILHCVERADAEPEFIENLSCGYQLALTITSDNGSGLYLIKPTTMTLKKEG